MAQHPWLDPGPFFFPGNKVGVLLIHGFTGAPTEMRPLGEYLAARGYAVCGPLLPGHGTNVKDLAGRKWPEWAGAVRAAFQELAGAGSGAASSSGCEQVFAVGLSLGALLAINLAAEQSAIRPVDGLVLLSPAIFVANPLVRLSWIANWLPITMSQEGATSDLVDPEADSRTWCYGEIPGRAAHQVILLARRIPRLLPSITAPTLVVMSRGDKMLRFESGPFVIDRIAAEDKELVTLHGSGHNILADAERELVWKVTAEFVARVLGGSTRAPA